MRASRHNGRSGKHGVYDAKHNDRNFNVSNSEHIDAEKTRRNIYWDCYQGYCLGNSDSRRKLTFSEVEKIYYLKQYGDHVEEQNKRNEKGGHAERNRTIEDVLKNSKTCPEESLLQLGNMDYSVSPETLVKVVAEFFEEFQKRYGSHVHILDWALHLDEATPHVHVRQVYDAANQYGELCPMQDKALEELGFDLPDPSKKKGRYNNRKMAFDAECRKLFLEIAGKNGVMLECEPIYGGASYLEKQDYIIEKQRNQIVEQQIKLETMEMKLSDLEKFAEEVAEEAYDKACEVIADSVIEQTKEEEMKEIKHYKNWLSLEDKKIPKEKKEFAIKCLDALENHLRKISQKISEKIRMALQNPNQKDANKEAIKENARASIREKLSGYQKMIKQERNTETVITKMKNREEVK